MLEKNILLSKQMKNSIILIPSMLREADRTYYTIFVYFVLRELAMSLGCPPSALGHRVGWMLAKKCCNWRTSNFSTTRIEQNGIQRERKMKPKNQKRILSRMRRAGYLKRRKMR